MLQCWKIDGDNLSVPHFFAVGETFPALFCCAVKGGGSCQKFNVSTIFKVQNEPFLLALSFHNLLYTINIDLIRPIISSIPLPITSADAP